MFFNIIYNIIVSIIIIYVVDNIFNYLKNTLTAPKIKDLIHKPKSSYEKINDIINRDSNTSNSNDKIYIDHLSDSNFDSSTIKSELKDFFNELNSKNENNNTDYQTINDNNYVNTF